jgi:predicted RNA-binding Zn ribbon-like protein
MRSHATGRELIDPKGGSFWFDAGAVCLDFAHTGGEGPYAVFETLHQPRDLADWLAGPPPAAVLTVPATGNDLAAAKTLRQAIWETAHEQAAGQPLNSAAVTVLNRAAAQPSLIPELTQLTHAGAAAAWASPTSATQALSTLAREMIGLLSGPLSERFRECAGDNCPLVFVDSSRPGARRWCAMERCGNRHKLRALRARQRTQP